MVTTPLDPTIGGPPKKAWTITPFKDPLCYAPSPDGTVVASEGSGLVDKLSTTDGTQQWHAEATFFDQPPRGSQVY